MRTNGQVRKPESTSARKQRASMMGQGTVADTTSGPAGLAPPQQAEDMTAPETFASLRSILDQGAPSRHEVGGLVCDGEGRRRVWVCESLARSPAPANAAPSRERDKRTTQQIGDLCKCHVWTAPLVKGFLEALRTSRVRSCLRPVYAGVETRWP